MIKRQTRYHVLMAVVGVLVVAMVGSVIGSNMGFKMTRDYTLNANPAARNSFNIALPHHNPWTASAGNDTDNLLVDMWDTTNSLCITRYQNSDPPQDIPRCIAPFFLPPFYTLSGTPFEFTVGEGYKLGITASLASKVLVGSHDPNFLKAGPQTLSANPNPAARNAFPVAVTPNMKYGEGGPGTGADELLAAWWDGTNSLCLTRYQNSDPPQDIPRCIAPFFLPPFYTFSGTAFDLAAGEGYDLGITADIARPQSPYY